MLHGKHVALVVTEWYGMVCVWYICLRTCRYLQPLRTEGIFKLSRLAAQDTSWYRQWSCAWGCVKIAFDFELVRLSVCWRFASCVPSETKKIQQKYVDFKGILVLSNSQMAFVCSSTVRTPGRRSSTHKLILDALMFGLSTQKGLERFHARSWYFWEKMHILMPVVPHKAVAEVSNIGNR